MTACVMVRVSYKSQRVSNFHSSRSTATKNCLMPSKVNSSLWQTIGGHHGKVLFKVIVTFSSKNNYFFYANKNVTHRLTRILIGSVMNFCVISKISCGRVALNRTTWTHLKRIRIVTLDTITSRYLYSRLQTCMGHMTRLQPHMYRNFSMFSNVRGRFSCKSFASAFICMNIFFIPCIPVTDIKKQPFFQFVRISTLTIHRGGIPQRANSNPETTSPG